MTLRHALCTATVLGLCACSTPPLDAPLSPVFGVAAATLQSQVIAPPAEATAPPASSGARGVEAIRRYERGEVRTPDTDTASPSRGSTLSSGPDPRPAR